MLDSIDSWIQLHLGVDEHSVGRYKAALNMVSGRKFRLQPCNIGIFKLHLRRQGDSLHRALLLGEISSCYFVDISLKQSCSKQHYHLYCYADLRQRIRIYILHRILPAMFARRNLCSCEPVFFEHSIFICFPSIAPKTCGVFHNLLNSLLINFRSSSLDGGLMYIGDRTL